MIYLILEIIAKILIILAFLVAIIETIFFIQMSVGIRKHKLYKKWLKGGKTLAELERG